MKTGEERRKKRFEKKIIKLLRKKDNLNSKLTRLFKESK